MTDERIDGPESHRQDERREWVKPAFQDMLAGCAENNPGDTAADGSATFS
jgi:hypothetical protein